MNDRRIWIIVAIAAVVVIAGYFMFSRTASVEHTAPATTAQPSAPAPAPAPAPASPTPAPAPAPVPK